MKPRIFMLQETKIKLENKSKFQQKWRTWKGSMVDVEGASGGLSTFWRSHSIKGEELALNRNWLVIQIKRFQDNKEFILINVYGPTSRGEKTKVWEKNSNFLQLIGSKCVILGGDFNAIRSLVNKMGGIVGHNNQHFLFKNFIERNTLIDQKFKNGCYTWTNRQAGDGLIA